MLTSRNKFCLELSDAMDVVLLPEVLHLLQALSVLILQLLKAALHLVEELVILVILETRHPKRKATSSQDTAGGVTGHYRALQDGVTGHYRVLQEGLQGTIACQTRNRNFPLIKDPPSSKKVTHRL